MILKNSSLLIFYILIFPVKSNLQLYKSDKKCESDQILIIDNSFKLCEVPNILKSNYCEVLVKNCILNDDFKSFLRKNSLPISLFNVINETVDIKNNFIFTINFNRSFNIKILDVSGNNLKNIDDIFKYLPELETLDFGYNNINKLPNIIKLNNLTTLHASNNNYTNFNEDIFSKLINLRSLHFDIINSNEKFLQNLFKLDNLLLNVKMTFNITKKFFQNNKLLNHINIHNNVYGKGKIYFDLNSLDYLINLKIFIIKNCEILNLPKDIFFKNKYLKELYLIKTNVSFLPEGVFETLNNLEILDLSFNKLNIWKKGYFNNGFKKLKYLNLKNNLIKNLDEFSFYLDSLIDLDLSNNLIFEINSGVFNSQNLESLNLMSNNLDDISNLNFDDLPILEEINLSFNKFKMCPDFDQFPYLKKIIFNNNLLKELPLTYIGIGPKKTTKYIDVSKNHIEVIKFATVRRKLIENQSSLTLNINENPLKCDCRLFHIRNNENIQFEYKNNFCNTTVNYNDLKCDLSIATFKLNKYECPKRCKCWLYPFNTTIQVDCSNLNLTSIPKLTEMTFFNIDDVYYDKYFLDLSGNLIKEFNKVNNYTKITGLSLSKNDLKTIKYLPSNIKILELDNNNLEFLEEDVLNTLKNINLTKITLHNNPWKCNCNSVNFSELIQENLKHILPNESILCTDLRNLQHLTPKELCYNIYPTLILLIVTITLIVITLFVYFKYKRPIGIFLHLKIFSLLPRRFQNDSQNFSYDAFVCYSYKDTAFIEQLVKNLENDQIKLCIHVRDWIVSEYISKQIQTSLERSRRTIVVLSEHFLRSEWGKTELIMAYEHSKKNTDHLVIVIVLDSTNIHQVKDKDWRLYLKKISCVVKFNEKMFWSKLKYYIVHNRN